MKHFIVNLDKRESIIIKAFRIAGMVAAVLCVCQAVFSDIDYSLWILPLTYSVGVFILGNTNVVRFTPGIITLNMVMFCRYILVPLVMYMNGNTASIYAPQYDHMQEAVLLMWGEQIMVFAAIYFTGRRFRQWELSDGLESKQFIVFNEMKYGDVIGVAGIILCVVLMIRYPHLIGGFELITQGYLSNEADLSSVSGLVGILWKAWTIWLGVYFIYLIKKKKLKGGRLTFFLLLGMALILLISLVGQTTISRWYSVVTFCAVYFCVIKMFPEKKKQITRLIMVPAVCLLLVLTIYKNTSYLGSDGNMLSYIKDILDMSTLNSYFAGPFSVNNVIHMNEEKAIGFGALFFDLLRNFPVINGYIDVSRSTVGAYASYLGRGDQIIPLVGQAKVYFGYFLSPLLSVVSVYFVRLFDYKYLKSTSLNMYMHAFTACWIGLVTILNLTICVSWFYVTIIPVYLLIKLTEITGTYKANDGL